MNSIREKLNDTINEIDKRKSYLGLSYTKIHGYNIQDVSTSKYLDKGQNLGNITPSPTMMTIVTNI